MADRKPLVLSSDGTTEQLQAGDRLVDAYGAPLGGGTSAAVDYVQDTLLGLTEGDSGAAISAANPKTVSRLLNVTSQFLVRPVLVLKLETGAAGVTRTACGFNLADAGQFSATPNVTFSGVMAPATSICEQAAQVGTAQDGKLLYRTEIDRSSIRSLLTVSSV